MKKNQMPMTFDVTEEHLQLVRLMFVQWNDCETGAPEIDPKRPYGNSDVECDVARHLGWDWTGDEMPADLEAKASKIHMETMAALQIVLVTGEFKPGSFKRTSPYDTRSWVRA